MHRYDDTNRPLAHARVVIIWPEGWMHRATATVRNHRGPKSLGKRVEIVLDKPPSWASCVQEIPPELLAPLADQLALF